MSRGVAILLCVASVLAWASPASAYWSAGGTGTGTATTATVPTGATPTATASARAVTVSWAQNAFAGTTVGGAGGSYTVTRYAEGSTTAVTPAAGCSAPQTGTASTLSCVEAGVPYGRWQYRITPNVDSFTGTQGPLSAVVAVVLDAPVLDPVAPQNPAAGAANGPIGLSWSAVTGATGYNVFRRLTGGSYDFATPLNGATPLTARTFSDTTAANAASYDYVVRAVASGPPVVISVSSNEHTGTVVTRPAAPAGAVTAASGNGGAINVAWSAVNGVAGYDLYRRATSGAYDYAAPLNGSTPLTATSFKDLTAAPGTNYRYVVHAIILGTGGVQVESVDSAESTTASCSSPWVGTVFAANPTDGFRFGEASGTSATNALNGARNGVYTGGVTLGQAGAITCDADTAVKLNGTTGYVGAAPATAAAIAPNAFTLELWFKTTVGGGKLVGFGSARTGASTTTDRHIYMTNAGQLVFGVRRTLTAKTVVSSARYDDGAWHLAAASLGGAGMRLYVDGAEVAADATVTSADAAIGYWRAGYDSLTGWGSAPTNAFFTGTLDELALFGSQLSAATLASHYASNRP